MRLSEAIRLGAMLRPQALNHFITEAGATCAFGAAFEAIGRNIVAEADILCSGDAMQAWAICDVDVLNPVSLEMDVLYSVVTSLNDFHGWTRERIADWVESIERSQEQSADAVTTPAQDAVTCPATPVGCLSSRD